MERSVHYHLSEYVSHRTAGEANMAALAGAGVRLAASPVEADVLLLHDDPYHYPALLARHGKGRRTIAYCVWETDLLPESFAANLKLVDEIWTCSPFCEAALRRAGFARVAVVPHVVAPPEPSPEELAAVRGLLAPVRGRFLFYTVVDSVNPRKNLKTLLATFRWAFGDDPTTALVVKQYRKGWDLSSLPGVLAMDATLAPGEMTALHRLCHAYVSAHHCEGWGLPLTDAMSQGKPVAATAHSGNMHFMNAANSFPVPCRLAPVSREMADLYPLFTTEMTWAEVDPRDLARAMRAARNLRDGGVLAANARREMARFTPERVGRRMRELLEVGAGTGKG
jgi:glycosyltransferase involved in cell wall biosynthesis